MGKAKVVRKRQEASGEISWKEIEFPRAAGGFRSKYKEPSLKVSKYGLNLYCVDFVANQPVKIFSNGSKIAIVPDDEGSKKIKVDKKTGKRFSLPGKKIPDQLGLEIGKVLSGSKGEVQGKSAWIFQAE